MNELINVNLDTQTVSARELHKEVGSTERFSNWFERQLQFGFVENEDYTSVKSFTVVNNGAKRELDDYELSVDMAKQICMVQKSERARAIRQYLIDLEKAWNTPEQVFARALKMADKAIENLQTQISKMKPSALLGKAITTANTSILVGDLAKILKQNGVEIGAQRLFQWMRNNGYLIKRKGTDWNLPTQRSMEMGLFEIKESVHIDGNGCNKISRTPKVTGKGQQYFVNKFLGETE